VSFLASALLVLATVVASGVFSGAETGFYSLSRARVAAGTGATWMARVARRLLRDEIGLLVALLVANNLVNQAATYAGRGLVAPLDLPEGASEVVMTLLLTPLLFLFGELFPKDLFRRRPHALVVVVAPVIWAAKMLLFPVVLLLGALARWLERSMGLDARELARVQGREEAVLEILREGGGQRAEVVEGMARNVLGLRGLRIDRVMIAWRRVRTVSLADAPAAAWKAVAETPFSRLPVVDRAGAVAGYVHQIELLRAGPRGSVVAHLRPLIFLDASMPIDRALAQMRASGLRMAAVGTPERPLGIVTVKDLVEEISGELARW
jgi:CBS domain containing-hemolysin-like protein